MGSVTFVYEAEDIAFGMKVLRQLMFKLFKHLIERLMLDNVIIVCIIVFVIASQSKLMNKRTNQRHLVFVEHTYQFASACCPNWDLSCIGKTFGNLQVKFVSVGYNNHSCVRLCLFYPLCQHHHSKALAASLRMPHNSILFFLNPFLCCLQRKILIGSCHFFHAIVKNDAILNKPQ